MFLPLGGKIVLLSSMTTVWILAGLNYILRHQIHSKPPAANVYQGTDKLFRKEGLLDALLALLSW
jgi:hypothetical protein